MRQRMKPLLLFIAAVSLFQVSGCEFFIPPLVEIGKDISETPYVMNSDGCKASLGIQGTVTGHSITTEILDQPVEGVVTGKTGVMPSGM